MTSIVASDILTKLSAPNATSGSSVQGFPGTSWGKYISTTVLSSTPEANLFTDLSGAQNAAGQVDYACVFIHNNTSSGVTATNVVAWLPSQSITGTGCSIAMALDTTPASSITSSSPQALTITSSTVAPAGITTWVVPTNTAPTSPNFTNGLQIGSLPPGQCVALWVRRTALGLTNPVNPLQFSIQVNLSTI